MTKIAHQEGLTGRAMAVLERQRGVSQLVGRLRSWTRMARLPQALACRWMHGGRLLRSALVSVAGRLNKHSRSRYLPPQRKRSIRSLVHPYKAIAFALHAQLEQMTSFVATVAALFNIELAFGQIRFRLVLRDTLLAPRILRLGCTT